MQKQAHATIDYTSQQEETPNQEPTLKATSELFDEATKLIRRKTLYAAGAGLLPFPVIDAALLLGIQLTMIRSISNLYRVEFKENLVKSIIGSLVGTVGTTGVIKAIPGLGTILGGLTTATAGAAATYALGRVFAQHFDQGGTLLNFDPEKTRHFFEKEFEAGRMFVSDVSEVENQVENEKKGIFSNLFKNKKSEEHEALKKEMLATNQQLMETIDLLRKEIEALKK